MARPQAGVLPANPSASAPGDTTSAGASGDNAALASHRHAREAAQTDALTASASFAFTGDITPTQLAADTDNWAPTGLSTAAVIRVSTDASRALTGLTGGADGRLIVLINIGSFDLVLQHSSGGSTSANRFFCAGSASITLPPNGVVFLVYDATSLKWRAQAERAASSTTPAAIGTAAIGTGTTDAHADHVHATGAGTPSTQAFGDAAATGTGPAAAMTDHKHAMPANPVSRPIDLSWSAW